MSQDAASALAGSLRAHFARLPQGWRRCLAAPLAADTTSALVDFVDARLAAGATIYPPQPLAALEACTPPDVRVVILGQDPYHGPGQAHGFAFSVPHGVRPPPSLRNIFFELSRDCGCPVQRSGCLLAWAHQGVLLLNSVLTVEAGQPGSHAARGWEPFTDSIIVTLARLSEPKVFMLWGAQAQAKREQIDASSAAPHLVLCANHPSPLSARRPPQPFLGCGHFSQANRFLVSQGCAPIDWCR